MRRFLHLTVASALALATACRDAAAPEPRNSDGPPATPSTPTTPQTPPQATIDAVLLNLPSDSLLFIVGDTVVVVGRVRREDVEAPDTLSWESSDTTVATIESVEKNSVEIRALRSGSVTISALTQSARSALSKRVVVQVFARSNRASPIVVDEFSLLQTRPGTYEPKLRLRDTSAAGTARVVGLAFDFPPIGRSVRCAVDRIVGAGGWSAFNPPGDMNFGFFLTPNTSRPGPPTVRVSAVLSGGFGVSWEVSGTMEIDDGWSWFDGDDTGVRCQIMTK